ncbi:MAG: Maf family protein [Candidatus Micrarchaeota archaeon]
MDIVLSSSSPRRRKLLSKIKRKFEIAKPSPLAKIPKGNAKNTTKNYAEYKSVWAALRNPGKICIGADTLIEFNGKIIGKPENAKHAKKIINSLNDKKFLVYTSVCISYFPGKGKIKKKIWSERASVKFRKINAGEIRKYIKSGKWKGKAGGFNINEMPVKGWVEKVEGDKNVVIGLPMKKLWREIKGMKKL